MASLESRWGQRLIPLSLGGAFPRRPQNVADRRKMIVLNIDPGRFYKTHDVARILECSVRYVQVLVEVGRLGALKVGRFIRIPGDDLLKFIDEYREWDC